MIKSENPYDPDDLVLELEAPGAEQVSDVVSQAVAAGGSWAGDALLRSRSLSELESSVAARRDEFVELMVREVGKPLPEAQGELDRALAILRYYSQVALDANGSTYPGSTPGAQVVVRRAPLGVVLAICPWNFPLAIPVWKVAPALAYGNTVVMKPASPAIATAALLQQCVDETLPKGALAQLLMSGSQAGELLDDPRIAAATFTGSTEVGLSVVERLARRAAPSQAEMGGQNPAIVLDDANLVAAADSIVGGAMGFAGQKCTATRRVVAVSEVAAELETLLVERVKALGVGDPRSEGVSVGPLISAASAADFDSAVEAAIASGAKLLASAERPDATGYFVSPALLREHDVNAKVNQEETFGPLLTMIEVADAEAALQAANATKFGLVAAVHGRDLGRAVAVADRLECGLKRINAPTPGVDYYAPFGGVGQSSFGPREQGRAAGEFFTTTSTMTVIPSP